MLELRRLFLFSTAKEKKRCRISIYTLFARTCWSIQLRQVEWKIPEKSIIKDNAL